jgi:putative endopeptidase
MGHGGHDAQARYDRSMNSLYIPAGLIQPPFFDSAADPAVNFGGIGVLAAHELTHGFDALGSKYDERGNVRDWWSPDDRKQFAERRAARQRKSAKAVPKSDDAPRPSTTSQWPKVLPTMAACASLIGRSWTPWLRKARRLTTKSDGYTESQRFFLSFAQARVRIKPSFPPGQHSQPTRIQWDRCA